MADGNARTRDSRNGGKEGRGLDKLSLRGVDHEGLVTERDIDAEFGLFEDEVPMPVQRKHKNPENERA